MNNLGDFWRFRTSFFKNFLPEAPLSLPKTTNSRKITGNGKKWCWRGKCDKDSKKGKILGKYFVDGRILLFSIPH
jgi:hypothetical protein